MMKDTVSRKTLRRRGGLIGEVLNKVLVYKEATGRWPRSIRMSNGLFNTLAREGHTKNGLLNVKIDGETVRPIIIIDKEFTGFIVGGM